MRKKVSSGELLEEAERIDREEIEITDEEAEGRWIFVRPRPSKEPSQIYSIRLPVSVIDQLRIVAASKGEAPTALLRDWVLERLDDALKEKGDEGSRPVLSRERTGVNAVKTGGHRRTGVGGPTTVRSARTAASGKKGMASAKRSRRKS